MDEIPGSMYFIVEFPALPRPDVDKYVCVPGTWIRWIDKPNSTVGVAFPKKKPAEIEELARMNQSDPNYWLAYNASVKYYTPSYEIAMIYLKVLRELGSSRAVPIVTISRRRFSEGPLRPRSTATTSNNGGICGSKKPFKLVNISTTHQTRPQQMMQSSVEKANLSSVPGTQYPVHDDRVNRSLRASRQSQPMSVSQHNNPSTSRHDVQATQSISHEYQRSRTTSDHACCATKFDTVMGSIQANVQKLVTGFNHWATVNATNNEKLIEVGTWVKEYQIWKRSLASQQSERPPMTNMPRKIKAENILVDDDVDHGNSTIPIPVITTQEPRIVQQTGMAQFTLPPEYDRNDSRWTLRYRSPGPTLTELVHHSGIYADSLRLAYCLICAQDCKSLARLLIGEVFSDNALKVCSFTGARCSIYSRDSPVRPGLDENGRNMLLKYIEKHGRRKGWYIPDPRTINKVMRIKLDDYRRKTKNAN